MIYTVTFNPSLDYIGGGRKDYRGAHVFDGAGAVVLFYGG